MFPDNEHLLIGALSALKAAVGVLNSMEDNATLGKKSRFLEQTDYEKQRKESDNFNLK